MKPVQYRSLSSARVGLALTLALGLGACADALTGTLEPTAGASKSLAIATPSDAQTLAKGLALAMRDPSIRAQVHAAMRGSSFNEHKLVLQDFANTPPGEYVLSAVAAALGQSLGSVKSEVASLPALDFYLPFPAHRQRWKPTGDVYVATTFDKRAPSITAYGSSGQVLELRQADGVPAVPLIILHPAEPKTTSMPGNNSDSLIESPTRMSTASLVQSSLVECGDTCSGGGGGDAVSTAPGTYITHFNIKVSDGWFGGSEIVFHSWALAGNVVFVHGNGGTNFLVADHMCPKGDYGQSGVNTSQGYYGPYMLSPTVYKGSFLTCDGLQAGYAVHLMESDGGALGADDDFGWRFYYAGAYPAGTMYDIVYSYYKETYPAYDDTRSAYVRLSIY